MLFCVSVHGWLVRLCAPPAFWSPGTDSEVAELALQLTRVLFTLVKATRRDYCQGINIVTGMLLSVVSWQVW